MNFATDKTLILLIKVTEFLTVKATKRGFFIGEKACYTNPPLTEQKLSGSKEKKLQVSPVVC